MRRSIYACQVVGLSISICMSYEEEDTCVSYEEEDTCVSYEEEDKCMSGSWAVHIYLHVPLKA